MFFLFLCVILKEQIGEQNFQSGDQKFWSSCQLAPIKKLILDPEAMAYFVMRDLRIHTRAVPNIVLLNSCTSNTLLLSR